MSGADKIGNPDDDTAARLNAMSTRIDTALTGVDPQDILGADRLLDAINLAAELEQRTGRQLADLALQFAPTDLPRTYEAIVDELCSRVRPGREKDGVTEGSHGELRCQHCGGVL